MMYNISSITGLGGLGDPTDLNAPAPPAPSTMQSIYDSPAYQMLGLAGTVAGAYHGYKRNNSIGWAIVWGMLGGIVPIITIPVALAQGFGKQKQ